MRLFITQNLQKPTYVDKLNQILTSEIDFSLVHSVDGYIHSFVYGHRTVLQFTWKWLLHGQRRKIHRALPFLHSTMRLVFFCCAAEHIRQTTLFGFYTDLAQLLSE